MEGFFYCALYAIAIYNPGKNIWHKVKIYNKIGQDFKNIISNFACFFDSYCQRLISGRKTGN